MSTSTPLRYIPRATAPSKPSTFGFNRSAVPTLRSRSITTSPPARASVSSRTPSPTPTPTPKASSSSASASKKSRKPPKLATRVYTPRKTFLFSHYTHLLDSSGAILVFQHNNLSSRDLGNVRKALGGVKIPKGLIGGVGAEGQGGGEENRANFVIARTGVLAAVVQERERLARASSSKPSSSTSSKAASGPTSLLPLLSGPTALLTLPTLSPSYIRSLLAAVNKVFGYRPPASMAYSAVNPRAGEGRVKVGVPSELILLGGLVDGNRPSSHSTSTSVPGTLLSTPEIIHLSEHTPELSELHSQLVGLLSNAGGAGLVGVLGQAAGGGLVRTLMGLEEGLKNGAGEAERVGEELKV